MNTYNLITTTGDRMVSYEPIIARSPGEAIAFFQGLLAERTRHSMAFLAAMEVRYVLATGERDLANLDASTGGEQIASWTCDETKGALRFEVSERRAA